MTMRAGRIFSLVCALVFLWVAHQGPTAAQVPRTLNYQGYLASPGGTPVNATVSMQLKLYIVDTGGAPVYGETQSVTVTNGLFNALIGTVTPIPGTVLFDQQYFLGITIDSDAEMTPRRPLTASPYALRAALADGVAASQITGAVSTSQIANGAVTPGKLSANYAGSASAGGPATTAIALVSNGTNCGAGQFASGVDAQGNAEGCTTPAGGTVTTVATGTGLTGGPITGSGTVSVAPGGISSTELAANAVTTTKLADGNVTDAKIVALAAAKLTGTVAVANGGTGLVATGAAGNVLRSNGSAWASAALQTTDIPDLSSIYSKNSARNPLQIATLRWYEAIQTGNTVTVANPYAVAFDGANIWVTNQASTTVTKLRASDGACVGTCTFTVGTNPGGIAFDGGNMWVTNLGSNTVTKLRASDGACVGTCTFAVGLDPAGVAFDGANIWVANQTSNNVMKRRASDGACAGVVGPPTAACTFPVGTNPAAIVFDGANIWVTNNTSGNVTKL